MLADSRGPILDSLTAVLAARGRPIPPDIAERVVGPPFPLALQDLYGLDPEGEEVAAIIGESRARYATALLATPGFPGMTETLAALREAGLVLGVCTSKPLPYAVRVLEVLGLEFEVVEGPALDGTEGKTVTLERALARLPEAFALVGDRRHDVVASRAHGLLAVGVTWGIGSREELAAAGADVIVDQPAELVPLLLDAAATRASRSTSSFTTGP